MGCTIPCGCSEMPFLKWCKGKNKDEESKVMLERKLYLAKESPEPYFDLSDCSLNEVPSGIYSICKVFRKDKLILENNNIKSLEKGGSLEDLSTITLLNLNVNKFNKIQNIQLLTNLNELHLDHNQIQYLPDEIGALCNLRILSVAHNQLKELPKTLGNLKCLQRLNIKCNDLTVICNELSGARNLKTIELDVNKITEPPRDVVSNGTESIMRYLCFKSGIDYVPPANDIADCTTNVITTPCTSPFTKLNPVSWEDDQAEIIKQEHLNYELTKKHRDLLLNELMQDQNNLDAEIMKIQNSREQERQNLIQEITKEEEIISNIVRNFAQSNSPLREKQLKDFEAQEHDNLLDSMRIDYENIQKTEILKAMELHLIEKSTFEETFKSYGDNLSILKHSLLDYEVSTSEKLSAVLNNQDEVKMDMIKKLLDDQDLQKQAVASLLEKVDKQSWSLNQEVAIITNNLSKLTQIEIEKQKLKIDYNMVSLSEQRVHLMEVLQDLFNQQKKRQNELIEILKEMESQQDYSTNCWLINYQRLLDTAPEMMIKMNQSLDPNFANLLLQENVIHCLPFLVKLIFTSGFDDINENTLNECGITLAADRKGVLSAISQYLNKGSAFKVLYEPSAPDASLVDDPCVPCAPEVGHNECVVCLACRSDIVFLPCGHICCCASCSMRDISLCPLCREYIEKKIKVYT